MLPSRGCREATRYPLPVTYLPVASANAQDALGSGAGWRHPSIALPACLPSCVLVIQLLSARLAFLYLDLDRCVHLLPS